MYIDIHTHTFISSGKNHLSIYNLQPQKFVTTQQSNIYSVGIHPWYVPDNTKQAIEFLRTLAKQNNIVAVGECGIDKLCNTPIDIQVELLKAQISISEEFRKPLIIHCVRSYNEILELKKSILPSQPWIIHGFRGKPEVASMLIKAGMVLSIGEKFNTEAVKNIPIEKMLIESDESPLPIETIYEKIANERNISVEDLQKAIEKTYKSIFKENITLINHIGPL
ncbi:MAG: TatD family hydrolase [Bacteroidales bacterium]|nr:TatD family hydrolase [Bacteroidales bacterium]MBR5532019.1 TatD family hydrolase [Bacteroidales bacterium]